MRYAFDHDGQIVTAIVPLTRLRWGALLPVALPYLLIGVAFMVTGLLVFYVRPDLPAALAGLSLGMTLGMTLVGTLVLALDTLSAFWLQRLHFLLESQVPSALLHVALCFPERQRIGGPSWRMDITTLSRTGWCPAPNGRGGSERRARRRRQRQAEVREDAGDRARVGDGRHQAQATPSPPADRWPHWIDIARRT